MTNEEKKLIAAMVFGEAAGSDRETMKMVAQTVFNRLRSGRKKEFGKDLNDVLSKGYYAVKNPNIPYKQAIEGIFNDEPSKKAWDEIQIIIGDIDNNKDYGQAMFYFKPKEISDLKRNKAFDFSQVVNTGTVGPYETFGYKIKNSHYGK